jgi:hypothetical protein
MLFNTLTVLGFAALAVAGKQFHPPHRDKSNRIQHQHSRRRKPSNFQHEASTGHPAAPFRPEITTVTFGTISAAASTSRT